MKKITLLTFFVLTILSHAFAQTKQWEKYEKTFTSDKAYHNPLYDLKSFKILLTSPSGRQLTLNGFWDGDKTWKFRFAPDETGLWTFNTSASDKTNSGLHDQSGTFECVANDRKEDLYKHGAIVRQKGQYYLSHQDGKPFFFTACTAWNGPLKSTGEEWDTYLKHRVANHYNTIQFVTTQWRGGDQNSLGQTAYSFTDELTVSPEFFRHMDEKVDKINEHGLVAAPVLLWALPTGEGRTLSPGYVLPLEEAVMLAKYIIARYTGNQVIWILGGDGRYALEYEQRWLEIGRRVFDNDPPGVVAQHPHGRLWIGDNHAGEDWLDIVGYQSSHSNGQGTVDWINKGPVATRWDKIPAKPIINMEPNYEEINNTIDAEDVRNASWWSVFATPMAGIAYGANGIWPWIREGEKILNHRQPEHVSTWKQSIDFPGSLQIGYLSSFIQQFEWWRFRPANDLLAEQPGDETFNHFIAVSEQADHRVLLAYVPGGIPVKIRNPAHLSYTGQWYDPSNNTYKPAKLILKDGTVESSSGKEQDMVLVLRVKGG